ncbi:methyltransferase domain-containing protein [Pseudonocardia spinosispora]|uniref:methyltransferase domain-containing protein n=1 Tax=Pseudonocardia spinosispora TaxID=103441 RepID=UPI000413D455|nr:methyltransferase domain-containing protein [Pseudonocardia spinosispora]
MASPPETTFAVDVLDVARDRAGWSPRDWLTDAVPASPGATLELRSPADSDGRRVTLRRLSSLDTVSADPRALPFATNRLTGLVATLCLPSVEPLDALFGEIRRVLRPSGTLSALVPSGSRRSPVDLFSLRPVHRALAGHRGFRHTAARDHLGWLLTAADFAVLADQRRTFWLPVEARDAVPEIVSGLVAAGVWPPGLPAVRLERATAALERFAGPRRRLPIPLRLLVSRR